jgi:tetratricopeptide (TPR) repeat protein
MKMNKRNTNWQWRWFKLLLIIPLAMALLLKETPAASSVSYFTPAVESLFTEAKIYYETGRYEQAAALLERALRIEPRNPILWYHLAVVRFAQQDWKRAGNLAEKSNALTGNERKYRQLRTRNLTVITRACEKMRELGQYKQAAALLERALRINSRNSILLSNLAQVRFAQKNWKRAINLAKKSNKFAGNNKKLRVDNWALITQACERMRDFRCSKRARRKTQKWLRALMKEQRRKRNR